MALDDQTSHGTTADPLPLDKIDVGDPALYLNDIWHAPFERLRREDPVHYCPENPFGPYWSVTKYDDIMRVELDHTTYSAASRFWIRPSARSCRTSFAWIRPAIGRSARPSLRSFPR